MTSDSIFQSLQQWMLDHGWRIALILLITMIIRRFGVELLSRLVDHSAEASGRFETERDRKLRVDTVKGILRSGVNVVTGAAAGILILSELGVFAYFAPLFSSAVVVSLVLSFGVQTFVKDYASGLFIVTENQYRVGDVVHLYLSSGGDFEGTVLKVMLRTTVIRDSDGAVHFVPNGNIARTANQTLDFAKVNIELSLPLAADFKKAEKAINDLGLAMSKEELWQPLLIQAPYYHGVQKLEAENAIIEVRAKTLPAEQWRVSSEIQQQLASLLSSHDYFETKKRSSKKS